MDQTDRALASQRRGDSDAKSLFIAAFELERQAALMVAPQMDAEPTRSILHRSAASLALDCGLIREAEILICEALRGNPPEGIAGELRDLLEQVHFQRHLELRGISLTDTEIQMSIAGKAIGAGIAPIAQFLPRILDAEKLMYRTAERLSHLPFRSSGRIPGAILNSMEMFSTVPRPGSFAVSLRVGQTAQMKFPGTTSLSEETIDDLLECLDLFSKGAEKELRKKIPQEDYYTNFVGLARNLGPDGEEVNIVGLSAMRQGILRTVSLTPRSITAEHAIAFGIAALTPASSEQPPSMIQGVLREADSRDSKRGKIHVVDAEGASHTVVVPPGMMSDIVKPLWESEVVIVGERKGKSIFLKDIRAAKRP